MKIFAADAEGVAAAAEAIRNGDVILYPTETVYGLGADPFNAEAIARVYACKGRPVELPLLLVASDMAQVESVVESLSAKALRYAEAFWPGPLSLLLPKGANVPDIVTSGRPKVCVRVPGDETARAICREAGHAIVSTSANASGEPPARSLADLTIAGIAVAIDGGVLPHALPSTVYDPDTDVLLREGAVTREMLTRLIKA